MPKIIEGTRVDYHDERAEIVLEPDQATDLVQHWKNLQLRKNGSHDKDPRYLYELDGVLLVTKLSTTSPDVFVSFICEDDWRKHVAGGPWLLGVGIEPHLWHVPVRRQFSMTAHNRSRETIRTTIYMQIAARARVGW